jgi:pimeloyl-[acyl-carrier protein] synthase
VTVAGGLVQQLRDVANLPQLLAFVLFPQRRRDPYPQYRRLREAAPVYDTPFGVWLVSGHAEVTAALRHPHLGSDESKADMAVMNGKPVNRLLNKLTSGGNRHEGPFTDVFGQVMLFRDPPDHTRLRSLVSKAFTPKTVESLNERVVAMLDEILDRVDDQRHMDLMAELAYPLPARVICELLGVPAEDQHLFVHHAPALATGLDPSPMRNAATVAAADDATRAISEYLNGLIDLRRGQAGDDLLSGLIAAEEAGDRLSREELVATCLLLLIAGHETTANLIGNGMLALFGDPAQAERLREDPELDRPAIEELMRYDGPIQMAERIALEDIEMGGQSIPKGSILILLIGAANRDPDAFSQPDGLDLGRAPNPHVGFGGGSHFCIGAPLARMEARVVIPTLLRRFPNLRPVQERADWRPSFTIRGLRQLAVAW